MSALTTTDWILIFGFLATGWGLERVREVLAAILHEVQVIETNTAPEIDFGDGPTR